MTNNNIITELRNELATQADYFKNTLNYTFGDWESNVDYSHNGFITFYVIIVIYTLLYKNACRAVFACLVYRYVADLYTHLITH